VRKRHFALILDVSGRKNYSGREEFLLFHVGTEVSEASPEWITVL